MPSTTGPKIIDPPDRIKVVRSARRAKNGVVSTGRDVLYDVRLKILGVAGITSSDQRQGKTRRTKKQERAPKPWSIRAAVRCSRYDFAFRRIHPLSPSRKDFLL